jgi:hypothetical protein
MSQPTSPPPPPHVPPPNTPPPSNPPAGPRHPQPTRPPNRDVHAPHLAVGRSELLADAERQGAALLHLLSMAQDGHCDCPSSATCHLNAAAQHVSLALSRLARIDLAPRVEGPAPGSRQPGVGLAEGRHRLLGRVRA